MLIKFRVSVDQKQAPGGGLGKYTYADRSVEFGITGQLNKYFATDRKPKKILSEKQNPKKYPHKA